MAVCVLITLWGIISTNANAIEVGGMVSCGTWIKESSVGVLRTQNQLWLIGFLSGIAFGTNRDLLKGVDKESIIVWVNNYCQSNPLDSTADAGAKLSNELKAKKGL